MLSAFTHPFKKNQGDVQQRLPSRFASVFGVIDEKPFRSGTKASLRHKAGITVLWRLAPWAGNGRVLWPWTPTTCSWRGVSESDVEAVTFQRWSLISCGSNKPKKLFPVRNGWLGTSVNGNGLMGTFLHFVAVGVRTEAPLHREAANPSVGRRRQPYHVS